MAKGKRKIGLKLAAEMAWQGIRKDKKSKIKDKIYRYKIK
jgi:hypothetical protein